MEIEEKYQELYDKIADLQVANQCLSKRLEGMSRAMKGMLDFLTGNAFKVIKTMNYMDGSCKQYDIYKSLDSSVRNEFKTMFTEENDFS